MKALLSLCWLALAASPLAAAEVKPELLHGFAAGVPDLSQGVVPGPGGNFYGVSASGGKFGRGTFFRVEPPVSLGTGTVTVLADFGDPLGAARGVAPSGMLAFDGVGKFYGVTRGGGTGNLGTIFRVTLDGTVETLVEFTGFDGAAIGGNPEAGLTLAGDGNFYGTTANGGPVDGGTIFRVSTEGRFKTLVVFTGRAGAFRGSTPQAPLLALADGSLLGTTFAGGGANLGTIFRLTTDGVFKSVASFTGRTGALQGGRPFGHLAQTADGAVHGLFVGPVPGSESAFGLWKLPPGAPASRVAGFDTTTGNYNSPTGGLAVLGSNDLLVAFADVAAAPLGALFKVTPAGDVQQLSPFDASTPVLSFYSDSGPVSDGAGGFVGAIFGSLYRANATGTTVNLFAVAKADAGTGLGARPNGQVIFAPDGTLYGYCAEGGANAKGTVFKLPNLGTLSLLAALPPDFTREESQPLALDASGNVLLSQSSGGTDNKGRILQIDSSGIVTTRADFLESDPVANTPARFPMEGLTRDALGAFYGLAFNSGATDVEAPTLYRLPVSGPLERVAVLGLGETFIQGGLTLAPNGNLVGALPQGGTNGQGVIFNVTPAGAVTTLATFNGTSATAGSVKPAGPLLLEPSGSFLFFARVPSEEAINNIVRLNPGGGLQLVASLRFEDIAGAFQRATPLTLDGNGRIYALFSTGGANDTGVIVRLENNGSAFQVAHEFRPGAESDAIGIQPGAGLKLGPDGMLYGTTTRGGPLGGGTLFRFSPTVQATGDTSAATDVQPNAVTFNATLNSNGYGGEFWFTFRETANDGTPVTGAPEQETEHVMFGGFHGAKTLSQAVAALPGHRTYTFQFHAIVGFGADAITIANAASLDVTVPNGKPLVENDSILINDDSPPYLGDLLINDVDPDGDVLTFDRNTDGALGTVVNVDGKLAYVPGPNFVDRDSFTYTVKDGFGETATATVNVMLPEVVAGDYSGLLLEQEAAAAIPREGVAAAAPVDRLVAGFAKLALARNRNFTARFEIGSRAIPLRGQLATDRDTTIRNDRSGLAGSIRPLPRGFEGRVTIDGRTLVLVAGQGFFAAGQQRPESDFTIRLTPDDIADPVAGDGIPAGSGLAVIQQGRTARAKVVGVLPDGTPFSKGSTVDPDGLLPFFAQIYKGRSGSIGGTLRLAQTGEVDAAPDTTTQWRKPVLARERRFPAGFTTTLTVFGGRYEPRTPPLTVPAGSQLALAFDRGGIFAPVASRFDIVNRRPRPDADNNAANASLILDSRTGKFSGAFRPEGRPIKFRGVLVQRDNSGAGFFLGTADAGSVQLSVMP